MSDLNSVPLRWYQKVWGVVLVGLGSLILVIGIILLILTAKYWWQIKHGQGKALEQKFYGGFEQSVKTNNGAKIERSELETSNVPFLGNPNALIVVVAFIDYKCPNSKNAAPIMQKLADKYGYKVKIIIRNFPGESIHPGAGQLAQIASCAYMQDQNKYWNLYNALFDGQDQLPASLTEQDISDLADAAGLDYGKLGECLKSGKATVKVNKDYADGFKAGVSGTPTFFVNGDKVEGVVPFTVWEEYIKNF